VLWRYTIDVLDFEGGIICIWEGEKHMPSWGYLVSPVRMSDDKLRQWVLDLSSNYWARPVSREVWDIKLIVERLPI
jgi:hypothetical protein